MSTLAYGVLDWVIGLYHGLAFFYFISDLGIISGTSDISDISSAIFWFDNFLRYQMCSFVCLCVCVCVCASVSVFISR